MPKIPLTPETLQALSSKEFASVQRLIEAEEKRRLTATSVLYPPRGQLIVTPESAVTWAHEAIVALRHEWCVALFMKHTHELLALSLVYCGHRCLVYPRSFCTDVDDLICER